MQGARGVATVNVPAMRILYIEDNPKDQAFVEKALTDSGMTVWSVATLEDAFAIMCAEPFDLVLLDLGLPGHSDLGALRAYKEFDGTTPVVALSGGPGKGMHERATQMGAADYLEKAGMAHAPAVLNRILRRVFNTAVRPVERQLDCAIARLNESTRAIANGG